MFASFGICVDCDVAAAKKMNTNISYDKYLIYTEVLFLMRPHMYFLAYLELHPWKELPRKAGGGRIS